MTQLVRFTAPEAEVPAVEEAIEVMVAAIDRARPPGTRFASCKLRDGVTFLNVLELAEGADDPMPDIPERRAFQQQLAGWIDGPAPAPEPITVVGPHGLFS